MSDFLDIIVDRKLTYAEIQRGLVRILSLDPESILIGEWSKAWNSYKGEAVVCEYRYTQGDFQTVIEVDFQQSTFQSNLLNNIIDTFMQFCQELDCTLVGRDPNLEQHDLNQQFLFTYLFVTSIGDFRYVIALFDNDDVVKIIK